MITCFGRDCPFPVRVEPPKPSIAPISVVNASNNDS